MPIAIGVLKLPAVSNAMHHNQSVFYAVATVVLDTREAV
jgi:hypothetical protein